MPIARQNSIASSSGPSPSSSSPPKTVIQICSGSSPKPCGRQLPGELGRALLEVVADREVAEHLEEGQVALGGADVLDVDRAEALLAGGQPPRRRLLLAAEVGLERLHARGGEQHRRVVDRRHERRRGHAQVAALLEERQELLADLGGLHGAWSLGGRKRRLQGARSRATSGQDARKGCADCGGLRGQSCAFARAPLDYPRGSGR